MTTQTTDIINDKITQFKGRTFTSPEDVEKWLRDAFESIQSHDRQEFEKMIDDETIGCLYDYWEGENPYPVEVVEDVKSDLHEKLKGWNV